MIILTCKQCRAQYQRTKWASPKSSFCSRPCQYAFGVSDELREKIKVARAKQTRERHPSWKGGKVLRSGYIYHKVYDHPKAGKQGYVAEHRLVMEKHIGRYLEKQEAVHHIDGNILNNKIGNLQLFATHGQHTKIAHPEIGLKSSIANEGKRRSPKTEFKKGQVPWNKK